MEESRTQKSARNVFFTLSSRIVTMIMGFVTRMIFLRFLTTEYLGIDGLYTNILTMLSFAELGIGNVIQFSLYKQIKENNHERIKSLMHFYKIAYRYIATIIMLAGIVLIPILDFIVREKPDIPENLTIIYLLFLGQSASSYLFSYKQTLLQADQCAYVVNIANSITGIVQNILYLFVLFITKNYYLYLLTTIVCSVSNNIFLACYIDKKYPYLQESEVRKLENSEKKSIFRNVRALAISKIAGVVCNGTDNIITTYILGLASVGLASNYTLIINTVSGMLYSVLSGLTGSIGNLTVQDDTNRQMTVFDQVMMLSYLFYGCISTCIIVLADIFIGEVWLGPEYLIDIATTISLVLIAFQSGMNFPAYTFRVTMGYFDEVKYVYVGTAVLNVILSIIMGKMMGLCGIFFATILSKMLTCEIADGYYTFKKGFGEKVSRYFGHYLSYWLLFAVNTVVCYFVVRRISVYGIQGFLFKGTLCFVLCNGINIIALCRSRAFKELKNKMIGVVSRKFTMRKVRDIS